MYTRIKKITTGDTKRFIPEYHHPVFKFYKLKNVWEWKTFTRTVGSVGGTYDEEVEFSTEEECREFLKECCGLPEKQTVEYIEY